jgi:hypothetical protein
MKIHEENRNMVLLAVVTLVTLVIASGATVVAPTTKPADIADRATARPEQTIARIEQAPSPDKSIVYVSDQPAVRMVGAPFVLNTNPSER